MAKTAVIGFPRIGEQRELKKILETYWKGTSSFEDVESVAKELRLRHLNYQKEAKVEFISVNDFSYYDNMLDTTIMLGVTPKRYEGKSGVDKYFAMARGDKDTKALEMTKWFNTNYHYLVPELTKDDELKLDTSKIEKEYKEAKEIGITPKINIIGVITYLKLSKRVDGEESTLEFIDKFLDKYVELVEEVSKLDNGVTIQFDEPHFVKDVTKDELELLKKVYDKLANVNSKVKIIVASYFESSNEATEVLVDTPIYGLALDFVHGKDNINSLDKIASSNKVLLAGVVDGRNIWINNIENSVNILSDIAKKVSKDNLVVSSSCSLLHVPYTLKYEDSLDSDIKSWLSFAIEKLYELKLIATLFFHGEGSLDGKDKDILEANKTAISTRKSSTKINDKTVQDRVSNLKDDDYKRDLSFEDRIKIQRDSIGYPDLATTTIGSFPQTAEIRKRRREFKSGKIKYSQYDHYIKDLIKICVKKQEKMDIDVLVHGEFERNDMVEYFGENLKGFTFSKNGWVQSYGSRCVKPPLIYGDVSREKEMTVYWTSFAQKLTSKPMKGMLTGPVTILNWSFVRDDIERKDVCEQIALAIRDEIDELQNNTIKVIQVDEAAFKEGYPLKSSKIEAYEKFALDSFLLTTAVAKNDTQIHTHMCYSEFNDIIKTIEAMDADVISIETARSGNELLKIFKKVGYKQEVGPGIYDIHSPRVPSVEEMKEQIKALLEVLPKEKLWINPDCGLKTRNDKEVDPSLKNMVQAVKEVRAEL